MGELYYSNPSLWFDEKRKKWRGQIAFKDENGKRRFKRTTLEAKGKRAAQAEFEQWHANTEAQAQANAKRDPYGIAIADTFIADYIEQYIDTKERTGVIQPSTAKDYRNSNKHIRRAFENMPISTIQSKDVELWIAELNEKDYSPSLISKCYRLLKLARKEATQRDAIRKNPLDTVKSPKRGNKKEGINALDEQGRKEILRRLDSCELSPVIVAAYIAIYAGLRREDVCGLQWRDVDFTKHVMWVKRAIGIGKGGAYVKPPKNDKPRNIYMPESLESCLLKWKEIQRGNFTESLASLKGDSYVIGYPVGYQNDNAKWFNPTRLTKEWHSLAKLFGIRGTEGRLPTFHDLRHTSATAAVAGGVDIKTVSSILGHSNAAMTLNTYASADPNAKREAAKQIEKAM